MTIAHPCGPYLRRRGLAWQGSEVNTNPAPISIQHQFCSLRLAAIAFAFPVGEGLLDFHEASGYLARAAIRQGALDANMPMDAFERLLSRLDRSIGEAILANEAKAANEIRDWLRLCVERGMLDPVTITEICLGINDRHGGVLPMRCVKFLIATEVPNA